MATLRSKSDQEIRELLDEYGIKHGPIVDTTRPLYEKKLKEAMAKDKKVTKPSSDKTFYREEQEEVTYVTYRTPVMYMETAFLCSDHIPEYSHVRLTPPPVFRPHVYNTPSYSSYSKPTPVVKSGGVVVKEEKTESSGRLVPLWIQFLVFLIVAGFLYFIFINMESVESSPFNRIQ
uniref:LEM domain-containing protein n=1 Tax=Oncorhynchus tshawytscha TaxID=74940 RepID=A0AAZ3PEQ8_ONCTS